ncbi:MAG: cob(I)yrinic acid a,c-diamide adenosyltransferase [Bacteriovoracaceae bacterium]|nr:cob(I)yrinic acid a,c-diamide adenosyltransferase [Bacteriovoracaceae bacterium]
MAGVYTKSGDSGETSLVGGTRLSKGDPQIDLYGEVDELNSFLGLAITTLQACEKPFGIEVDFLRFIQNRLFNLGSLLACEKEKISQFSLEELAACDVEKIEKEIDRLDSFCKPLTNFILPGTGGENSTVHICRSVCRRVERKMVVVNNGNKELEVPLKFINRLSDYFFVLARYCSNKLDENEILWTNQKSK